MRKRFLRPRPLFIWKFFIFHIISYFANSSGAPSARTARPSIYFVNIFARKSFYQGHRPRGSCAFSFPILRPRPTKRYSVCVIYVLMFINNCLLLVKYSD
uniref:Uncharacterized protein n=1 Tax=Siphoviridae sp. ct6oU4 TaxID=2826299 RepID=A0A8S5QPM3_9CAUD|nr:MAG TPA: hypothetical protein [Siphoviridae sp. ct6oU4]